MTGFRQAALGAALVMVAGLGPLSTASVAHAQSGDSQFRAFEIGRGSGSRIGVSVRDVDDTGAQGKAGVVVERVEKGGAADAAGVKTGDVITEFDGEKVRSIRQFSRLVQETPAGRSIAVALSRNGQRVALTVTAQRTTMGDDFAMRLLEAPMAVPPSPPMPALPQAAPRAPRPPTPPAAPLEFLRVVNGRWLGVTLETLDDQLAQYFGVKEGVLVKSVSDESAAQKAGLKAGDVITSVNGRQIYEAPDVNRAIERADSSDEFTMEIVRDKKPQTLKGKLEARSRAWS